MKIKTSELIGAQLDWAVAKAEGMQYRIYTCPVMGDKCVAATMPGTEIEDAWMPSISWIQGGPLIASHAIGFVGHDADNWLAFSSPCDETHQGIGSTHLIAAMRAIVAAKLGEEIEVPEELV